MGELMLSPDQFDHHYPPSAPSPREPGWLVRMRKTRYLDSVEESRALKRTRSEEQLSGDKRLSLPPPSGLASRSSSHSRLWESRVEDSLSWQLRKEFSLSRFSERRVEGTEVAETRETRSESARRAEPTRDFPESSYIPPSSLRKHGSKTQLLYPPGSTEHIASEKTPAERPREKVVYENRPLPPAVVAVNIDVEPKRRSESRQRQPDDDYSERLMSPPPSLQPKSILKQSYAAQSFSSREISSTSSADFPAPPPSLAPRQSEDKNWGEMPRPSSTTFQEMSEEERFHQMQENLHRHRQRSVTPQQKKYPVSSFNGPFFRLEEVTPDGRSRPESVIPANERSESGLVESHERRYEGYSLSEMKTLSSSEAELRGHNAPRGEDSVVLWPPPSTKDRPRSQSAMARNITDPERIDEFRRQKALEEEAIRRREERIVRDQHKQLMAMQIQQRRLIEQRHEPSFLVPAPPSVASPDPELSRLVDHRPPPSEGGTNEVPTTRVFETRPISALSDDLRDTVTSPGGTTWKRTFLVEKPLDVARNEILTSEEILERERFEIDLLKRREAFVEKPEKQPEIFRTGRRWQPPPEKPYIWPSLRRPVTVEPTVEPVDFLPGVPKGMDDVGEYRWQPVVYDPAFKRERKNFTPQNSPPHSPRRGYGTGPLDEAAKRQTKFLVQPSPDGSHRPKPAFKGSRQPPSGGFYPHAPNAIKVVKRRTAQASALSPQSIPQDHEDVEVIHQKNYHRLENAYRDEAPRPQQRRSRRDERHSESQVLHDWEKIYDLPPHSSTITGKDAPHNIDVRRRLALFEQQQRQLRANSLDSPHVPTGEPVLVKVQPPRSSSVVTNGSLLRRVDAPPPSAPVSRMSTPPVRPPSSLHPTSPQSDARQRATAFVARATAPSPTPPSYERARRYVPPALPEGYRRGNSSPPRVSPSQGNTRRMVAAVREQAAASSSRLHSAASTPAPSRTPSLSAAARGAVSPASSRFL